MSTDYEILEPDPLPTLPDKVFFLITQLSKEVPIVGSVVSAGESFYAKIENLRIQKLLDELKKLIPEIGNIKEDLKKLETVILACDQARQDFLFEFKLKAYASTTAFLVKNDLDRNDIYEILDNLKKLSGHDLNVLKLFNVEGVLVDSRHVAEMAGYTPIFPNPEINALREAMKQLWPTLKRLEGFGIIYIAANVFGEGVVHHDIGPLSRHLAEFANLTQIGAKLVMALSS